MAGRRADGLLLPEGCGPTFVAHAKEIAQTPPRPSGAPLELVVYTWLRIEEDDRARLALTDAVAHWVGSGLYSGPMREAGIDTSPEPGAISRDAADRLAVVGSAEHCAEAVHRFADAGAERLVLAAIGSDYAQQYERFAREVVPGLRDAETATQ
jgi:alkanesulfonate monooxygenase SsuD/methylene tetrahydromethanopterin reductase-like flavin-dependent oxidoreductase (luciferase family)